MNQTEQSELLATRAAVGRMPLARFLIAQGLSYNDTLTALKSAPRSKNLFAKGRAAALKILGKA